MNSFAEKIRSLVASKKESTSPATPFDFVKSRKGILRELVISKESGKIIGVYCKAFGDGMFLTAVEDIETFANEDTIIFHQYDISGRCLPRTKIRLDEIQMVCPFNKTYQKPQPTTLKGLKNELELPRV